MALLASVAVVTFSSGYAVTRAFASDDSAWLRKGTTIALVNGPAGRYEVVVAENPPLAGKVVDPLQVVQMPNGQVYTVDPSTRSVFRVNLSTMAPKPGPSGTAVLADGNAVFVIDASKGTVTPVNPQSLAPGRTIRVQGSISSSAISPSGSVYLGDTDGSVTVLRDGKQHTDHPFRSGQTVQVAVVGTVPVAIDENTGQVDIVGDKSGTEQIPGPAGGTILVSASQPAGSLWAVRGNVLGYLDVASGQEGSVDLPNGDIVGAPVEFDNRVYVPDDTSSSVLVFNANTLAPLPSIDVPAGVAGDQQIEVVVRDGRVWIDNPSSEYGEEVDPGGTVQPIDKGTGDGVAGSTPTTGGPGSGTGPNTGSSPSTSPTTLPVPTTVPYTPPAGPVTPQATIPPSSPVIPVPPTVPTKSGSGGTRTTTSGHGHGKGHGGGNSATGTATSTTTTLPGSTSTTTSSTTTTLPGSPSTTGTSSTTSTTTTTTAVPPTTVPPTTSPPDTQPPDVTVPGCVGQTSCQVPSGLNLNTSDEDVAGGPDCNTIVSQTISGGTQVPQGTTLGITVNTACAQRFSEWYLTGITTGANIWYLGFSPPSNEASGTWAEEGLNAYAFPYQGDACPQNTVGLNENWIGPSTGVDKYRHFYFTTGPPLSGWNDAGPIACVYPSSAAGSVAVSASRTNPGRTPADWSWDTVGYGSVVWYLPTGS